MEVVIDVRDLSYSYGSGVKALSNVTFKVFRGELAGVLGPNGAGKTTLLRCILGLLKPTSGGVYVPELGGKPVHKVKPKKVAKFFGYVPQTRRDVFAFKVRDFILMGRAPHYSMFSLPSSNDVRLVCKVAEWLGIDNLLERSTAEVSGGQMQLILIARALAQEAKVLILDEPTAHLDVSNAFRVMSIVRELIRKERIKAAVVSLHDPLTASLFCDRVIILNSGKVVAWGLTDEVLSPKTLEEVYGVPFILVNACSRGVIIPRVNGQNR